MSLHSSFKTSCKIRNIDCSSVESLCKAIRRKDFPKELIDEAADYLYTVGLINAVKRIKDKRIFECFIYLIIEHHKNLSQKTLLNILEMTLREYHSEMSVDTFCKIISGESASMVTKYLREKIHNYRSLDLIFEAYIKNIKSLIEPSGSYDSAKLSSLLIALNNMVSTCLLPSNLLDNLISVFVEQDIIGFRKVFDKTKDADIERAKGYRCIKAVMQEILERYMKHDSLYYKEKMEYSFVDKEDEITFNTAKYPDGSIGYAIITDSGYGISNRIGLGDVPIQAAKSLVVDDIFEKLFSVYRRRVNEDYPKEAIGIINNSFLLFENILKHQMLNKKQAKLVLDSLEQKHVELLQEREYYPFSEILGEVLEEAKENYGIAADQQKQS